MERFFRRNLVRYVCQFGIFSEAGRICFRNINDVDKTMDEINEQTENMKQIQDALSAPIGASAEFDEVRKKDPRSQALKNPDPKSLNPKPENSKTINC
jgi:hypothetical protein